MRVIVYWSTSPYYRRPTGTSICGRDTESFMGYFNGINHSPKMSSGRYKASSIQIIILFFIAFIKICIDSFITLKFTSKLWYDAKLTQDAYACIKRNYNREDLVRVCCACCFVCLSYDCTSWRIILDACVCVCVCMCVCIITFICHCSVVQTSIYYYQPHAASCFHFSYFRCVEAAGFNSLRYYIDKQKYLLNAVDNHLYLNFDM